MIRSIVITASVCALLLLPGCGGPAPKAPPATTEAQPKPIETVVQPTDKVERALARAATADAQHAVDFTLDAAEELLRRGDAGRATTVLTPLETQRLGSGQWLRLSLNMARIELVRGQADAALQRLSNPAIEVELADKPTALRAELGMVRAQAGEANGDILLAARERAFIHPWLTEPRARSDNAAALLRALARVEMPDLEREYARTEGDDWHAWTELALIGRDMRVPVSAQLAQLQTWQQNHATATHLDSARTLAAEMARRLRTPARVALLLPLSGKAAGGGRAILDGYLAARYADGEQGKPPATAVLDTATAGFASAYKQAVSDGAELVIGPLLKEDLAQFTSGLRPLVPTIALNFSDDTSPAADLLFQFGLDVSDETRQLVAEAELRGYRRVIVLTDRSSWATRSVTTFDQAWKGKGGSVIDTLPLGDLNEYRLTLERTLLVDRSNARAQALMRTTQLQFEHEPRRRQDVDFVALLADPGSARSINPMLAFLYAGDIPVWATSQIRAARADRERDHDLEGVRILDMPWFSSAEAGLTRQMQPSQDTPAAVERLYALGADAQRLQSRINLLGWIAPGSLSGATGELFLTPDTHRIARHADWAVFTDAIAAPEHPRRPPAQNLQEAVQDSTEGGNPWHPDNGPATSAMPASPSP